MAPLNDAINQLVAKEPIIIENLLNIKKQVFVLQVKLCAHALSNIVKRFCVTWRGT